jgi:hypothetical protein
MAVVIPISNDSAAVLGNLASDELANQAGKVRLHDDVFDLVHRFDVQLPVNHGNELDEVFHRRPNVLRRDAERNLGFGVETFGLRGFGKNQFRHAQRMCGAGKLGQRIQMGETRWGKHIGRFDGKSIEPSVLLFQETRAVENAPHAVVRTFERLVLFPLDICILAAGIVFLIEKSWLFGAFLLLMSLFLGIVGQALPHNKNLMAQQLYSQNNGQRFGNITREESTGLGKAVMLTAFLVSLIAGAAALHRDLSWYWLLGCVVASWLFFPVASMLFCFACAWMMEKLHAA